MSFNVGIKDSLVKSFSETPEVGICISSYNNSPTIYDGKVKFWDSDSKVKFEESITSPFKQEFSGLDKGTTYYYRAYVKLFGTVHYGDVRQVTTLGDKQEDGDYKIINGHRFVDLGLPSGLLWAETNIGAFSDADDGEYFAWGETTTKGNYYRNTYKYEST